MEINNWFEVVLLSLSTASYILQIYVILIVVYVSPPAMKSYRFFILSYTIYDLLFSFGVGYLIEPKMAYPEMLFVKGLGKYFGALGGNISMGFCVFVGAKVILSQDYALLYRLVAVQSKTVYMRYFLHPLTVVAINAAAILFAFGLALLTYHSLTPPQEFPKVLANYPEILEKLFNGSVFIRLKLNDFAILYVIAIGLFIQQIFTISACYGIFKTLNQNPYFFSKRTYVMHKQLTIILIVQLSIPIIFVVAPVFIEVAALMLNYEFSENGVRIGVILLSLNGVVNSILTIFFINPYRKFTLNWAVKLLPCLF